MFDLFSDKNKTKEESELRKVEKISKKVKLSLCLTNLALRHKGAWGSGCIDPRFLDLGTSWR
jgi:hypothetical protein